MHTVNVPINYRPNLTCFFRNDRKRWQLEYDLPHEKKIRMVLTLPKETSEKSANKIGDLKSTDLAKGQLTDKEHARLNESSGNGLLIADGLQNYLAISALEKTVRVQDSDRTFVTRVFSYFMSAEAFKRAKLLIDGPTDGIEDESKRSKKLLKEDFTLDKSVGAATRKWAPSGRHMREFSIEFGTRDFGYKFTHFHEIEEKHIFAFRNHLLLEIEKRKKFDADMRGKMLSATAEEKKLLMRQRAETGLAPMTAKQQFVVVRKVFNCLKLHKQVAVNPCAEVPNITLSEKDQVRTKTPTQEQITQILSCEYSGDVRVEFPIKEFVLFIRETGARKGEALHLERPDIVNGVWRIRNKENCPTKYGIGWAPKWLKERDIVLSPVALRVLELMPDVPSVGYVANDPTPYPAQFVFTCKDRSSATPKGTRRRCDSLTNTWENLLEAAGLPASGRDKIDLHDFRRFKNIENKHVKQMSLEEMCKELGNSARVNQSNYKGEVDPALLEIQAQIAQLQAKLQRYQGGDAVSILETFKSKTNIVAMKRKQVR